MKEYRSGFSVAASIGLQLCVCLAHRRVHEHAQDALHQDDRLLVSDRLQPGLPALQRAQTDAGKLAGRFVTGAVVTGLLDVAGNTTAIFHANHVSAPTWKITEGFFASTNKAVGRPTQRSCDGCRVRVP